MNEQELEDLKEFLNMLDFKKIDDKEVEVVSNRFNINELPASIQNFLEIYFNYLETVE